jgi:NAD-dependent histone deacetylase SIR2
MAIKIHLVNGMGLPLKFQEVKTAVSRSKRCVVIAGAGISVSSGIPDFRSPGGLFDNLKQRYSKSLVYGSDLFDANVFRDPERTRLLYDVVGQLKVICSKAKATPTHAFLKRLDDDGKLLRVYTQNIDSLEGRVGLPCARVVHLHGTLDHLICTMYPSEHTITFDESYIRLLKDSLSSDGFHPPVCSLCKAVSDSRIRDGLRQRTQGFLRPNIVLYNEPHPHTDFVGRIQLQDLRGRPDLLIVMGTSLMIPGVIRLVKEMAKAVHKMKRGKCVVVDKNERLCKEWEAVFDWHLVGESDYVVGVLVGKRNIDDNDDDEKENKDASPR